MLPVSGILFLATLVGIVPQIPEENDCHTAITSDYNCASVLSIAYSSYIVGLVLIFMFVRMKARPLNPWDSVTPTIRQASWFSLWSVIYNVVSHAVGYALMYPANTARIIAWWGMPIGSIPIALAFACIHVIVGCLFFRPERENQKVFTV